MLTIHIPRPVEKRLRKLARETGRSVTYYVCEAILRHLEGVEDVYLAERVLRRIRKGEERSTPLKTVIKRRGLRR